VSGNIIDASRYAFSDKDRILVDANVWLYLFGPEPPNSVCARSYSSVFKRMQVAKSELFLDVLVLSEFINAYARRQHRVLELDGKVSGSYKAFRDSTDFIPVAEAIYAGVLQIGKFAKPLDHALTACDLVAILAEFAKGSLDFNDQLIAACCKRHDLALLTNDSDLGSVGIRVFTTNPGLLARHA
jgi:predicted nucleic acid-binding protein